ncbi:Pyridoxine-5'-phosphate oxidase [Frankliniella fusca]|uniref:pyridoxal 5'-phosphate synthase n=1 Tax=Frankliniella fusca TaxID=407009 RepID=A0AAE1LTM2_9NEOP|nr:Pyridoxine-5'-phosphate oxidase [Frankliniella fusca]
MRAAYRGRQELFTEADLACKEPIGQFKVWFDEARNEPSVMEANAMCLATASKDGTPSARYVLLKGYGPDGFKFFTNYESRKAKELEENPKAALTFYWEALRRSVRIEGTVARLPAAESDEYFHSRPKASQIGACASNQSTPITGREVLSAQEKYLASEYSDKEIPRPNWGGYIVVPHSIEFWQGQSDRLHDRIRFRLPQETEKPDGKLLHEGDNGWVYERLSP